MDAIKKINTYGWADWSINTFNIDYEKILIKISYYVEMEQHIIIHCNNFIGFSFVGHWDENIIEDISIEPKGELIDKSLKEIIRCNGKAPMLGGGIKKLDDKWYQLNIKMIDGVMIKVACESIEMDIKAE